MGQFTNGVIFGLGISLLFAPKKGEEVRALLSQNVQRLRGNAPENEALKQQVHHMAERVQQTQDMASRVAEMGSAVQTDLQTIENQTGANTSPSAPGGAASTRSNQTRKTPS